MNFANLIKLSLITLCISGCGGGSDSISTQQPTIPPVTEPPITPTAPEAPEAPGIPQEPDTLKIEQIDVTGEETETQFFNGTKAVIVDYGELDGRQLNIRMTVNDETVSACFINAQQMTRNNRQFQADFTPTYLTENLEISCDKDSEILTLSQVTIHSTKNDLQALFEEKLTWFSQFELNNINVEELPRPKTNYYYEINNLISVAAMLMQPEEFGLSEENDAEMLQNIENYIINRAEFYFHPCPDYDFENGPRASCRSAEKVDGFYAWRSPMSEVPRYRVNHAKVEWRSVAGISQGIKAILLKYEDHSESCLISDLPGTIREQHVACRAKNIRRMIKEQMLDKWAEEITVSPIAHYLAWLELSFDMFDTTSHIEHHYECTNDCYEPPVITPKAERIDRMLEFVSVEDGYFNITCTPRGSSRICKYWTWDFAKTGSNDLNHASVFIHALESYLGEQVCRSDGSLCLEREPVIKTLTEKTWVSGERFESGLGFPKFDQFINGYCKENIDNSESSLQDYCHQFWFTEEIRNNAHRQLFGYVNFAPYNRELMQMFIIAADANKDGVISDDDVLTRDYVAWLYRAIQTHKPLN